MKKRKIFVDCHVFDGNLQGTTTYLKGLYLELIGNRDMLFYLASANPENLQTVFGTPENVVYLKYNSHNKFIRLLFDIPALIKKHAIDYAHFQYVVPPIKACKYIVTIHDVLFLDFPQYFPAGYQLKNKMLFGLSARYADIVLTVSPYSAAQIRKHFGIADITITPNAVDPLFFEPYDKSTIAKNVKEHYVIEKYWLYVSRWEPRKNHYTLLKVFVENGFYKEYYLVFLGEMAIPDKAYNNYFDALPEEIKSKIKSLTKISHADLLSLVRGADLAVYPSIAEGFGIPPLESLAAGIPTVCSNTTAMADFRFLEDGLFDPLDASDVEDKIRMALQDSNTQKRETIRKIYNWNVASQAFLKAIGSSESKRK